MKKIISTLIVLMTISLIFIPQAVADLNDGLVTYYPFNGNANDESGNGNDGTVIGATLTADRFGRANSAYSFDGIDNYIQASADNLPTAERTVSLWFFASNLSEKDLVHLGYGGGGGPPGTSWLMGLGTLKLPWFYMGSHWDSNGILYPWPQPPVGDWYHFVVATDKNGTKMYINGEEKASNGIFVTNTIVLNTDLSIGVAVSPYGKAPYVDINVGYFNGIIDDIRIYDRALSSSQILELFNERCSFVDVPPGYWAEDAICKIYDEGITTGCSNNPPKYCPKRDVTRDQMAAFLVRAVEGEPPADYCDMGSPYSDVDHASFFCKYIRRLSELGITQGCGGGKFCPKTIVTREQMAAFLVRAVEGEPDANYCDTGSPFSDVSPASVFCKYIKRLSELEITKGCGGDKYCPKTTVKRDQMAVFLDRAFLEME